jgi:hypothetical protein
MADMTGATSDLHARVEELEARLRQLEKGERKTAPLRSLVRELFPPEVRAHLRSARREQLLAVRSFVDHWIERAEKEDTTETRERITLE